MRTIVGQHSFRRTQVHLLKRISSTSYVVELNSSPDSCELLFQHTTALIQSSNNQLYFCTQEERKKRSEGVLKEAYAKLVNIFPLKRLPCAAKPQHVETMQLWRCRLLYTRQGARIAGGNRQGNFKPPNAIRQPQVQSVVCKCTRAKCGIENAKSFIK